MTKIRPIKNKEGKTVQLISTIPKMIAEANRWKENDEIEWLFDKGDVIVRKK